MVTSKECVLYGSLFNDGFLRSLQPNILMDNTGRARIAEFGLATVTQNLDSIRTASDEHGHTARWTAPEILNEEGTHSKEADVFSFAMVMIEVRLRWAFSWGLAYCHLGSS